MALKEVSSLVGVKSLRALNVFSALLLGLKMLPLYAEISFQTFYEEFRDKSEGELETYLRQAVAFVELGQDEIIAVASFCKDKNGVAYSAVNIANAQMKELHEIIVAVSMEVGRMKPELTSEEEKKKSKIFQSM